MPLTGVTRFLSADKFTVCFLRGDALFESAVRLPRGHAALDAELFRAPVCFAFPESRTERTRFALPRPFGTQGTSLKRSRDGKRHSHRDAGVAAKGAQCGRCLSQHDQTPPPLASLSVDSDSSSRLAVKCSGKRSDFRRRTTFVHSRRPTCVSRHGVYRHDQVCAVSTARRPQF